MAIHRVVVIEVPGPVAGSPMEYRVRPASVILGKNDKIRITNYTSKAPMTLILPSGPPRPLGNVKALPPTAGGHERIQVGPPHASAEGDYTYQVIVDTQVAQGESAPHVIIDP